MEKRQQRSNTSTPQNAAASSISISAAAQPAPQVPDSLSSSDLRAPGKSKPLADEVMMKRMAPIVTSTSASTPPKIAMAPDSGASKQMEPPISREPNHMTSNDAHISKILAPPNEPGQKTLPVLASGNRAPQSASEWMKFATDHGGMDELMMDERSPTTMETAKQLQNKYPNIPYVFLEEYPHLVRFRA